ncbi:MAG: hypothetical protein E7019_06060 [Alphaproteobacteria bacterium]|nr:hypothetical protein [Alphaproteobacteria bacterium]
MPKLEDHITRHQTLHKNVFNSVGYVPSSLCGLLNQIAEHWQHNVLKMFPKFTCQDVIIYGDFAGYLYNTYSEMYLGMVGNFTPNETLFLDEINRVLVANELKYTFLGHPVHCHFIASIPPELSCYSIIQKKWINYPQIKEIDLLTLKKNFTKYKNKISTYIKNLEKHDNNMLTVNSCAKLQKYLFSLETKAQNLLVHSDEHEYNQEYLFWRTYRNMQILQKDYDYLMNSYEYNYNMEQIK